MSLFKREENRRVDTLNCRILELEGERDEMIDSNARLRDRLQQELSSVKDELDELRRLKKHEAEDIAHLVKIKESKLELEFEKKVQANDALREQAIAKVKDEFRDKLEKQLREETKNIREMYTEILARLPNLNAKMHIETR